MTIIDYNGQVWGTRWLWTINVWNLERMGEIENLRIMQVLRFRWKMNF